MDAAGQRLAGRAAGCRRMISPSSSPETRRRPSLGGGVFSVTVPAQLPPFGGAVEATGPQRNAGRCSFEGESNATHNNGDITA
jgi:hypothetical protein